MKFYGSVSNRLEEGKNYTKRDLQVGDDITMYHWSDRNCYYITEVISQKEIKVKPYQVCADMSKPGGMGHQNWMYFKSVDEINKYLKQYDKPEYTCKEPQERVWVFRYGKWMEKFELDYDTLYERAKEDAKNPDVIPSLMRYYGRLNDKEFAQLLEKRKVVKYSNLSGNISFGVRDYYYDWEF